MRIHSSAADTASMLNSTQQRSQDSTQGGLSGQPLSVVMDKLAEKIPNMNGSQLAKLDPADFTPDKVAGRISGFVAQGLEAARQRGASDERLNEMYQAAVSGVQKGISEARDILDDMNLLSEPIAAGIDTTEQRTMDALSRIAPGRNSGAGLTTSSVSAAQRFSSAQSFDLELFTQDGDRITVQFAQRSGQSESAAVTGSGASYSLSRTQESQFGFTIEGDLDADEQEALSALIQDISDLSNTFFSGNIQEALNQADDFELDRSQFASIDLTLKSSVSYASAYSQVQSLPEQSQGNNGRHLGQLMGALKGLSAQPMLDFLKDSSDTTQSLYESLVSEDSRWRDADSAQREQFQTNLSRLLTATFGAPEVTPDSEVTDAVANAVEQLNSPSEQS